MNPWLSHVASYRQANPNVKYKQALTEAKATYKQPVVEAPPEPSGSKKRDALPPAPVKQEKKKVEKVVVVPPAPVVEIPTKKVSTKKASQTVPLLN